MFIKQREAYISFWECNHCGQIFRSKSAVRIHGKAEHRYEYMNAIRIEGKVLKQEFDPVKTL